MKGRPDVRTAGCNRPNAEDTRTEDADIVTQAEAARKEFARLQTEAALNGLRVERVLGRNGRSAFVLTRAGRAIDCADLDGVRAAMVRMRVRV